MNCIICAIAKLENDYIYEWAKYHLALGFSAIHIYDNNDIDGEKIADVFNGTECEDHVIIHDVRGQRFVQKKVYQMCYDNEIFDWCAFIDIDEFITFSKESAAKTINDFLKDKNNWEAVHLNWMCFGDCGMVYNSHQPVLERFKFAKKPRDFYYTYINRPENEHIKSIIRKGAIVDWCKDENSFSSNPHTPYGLTLVCDSRGMQVNNSPFSSICHKIAYVRHFSTKTIEEYTIKVTRQCADVMSVNFYSFPKFFRINRLTPRKILWLKKNHPEISLLSCFKERIKFIIVNRHLPLSFLFRSLSTRA